MGARILTTVNGPWPGAVTVVRRTRLRWRFFWDVVRDASSHDVLVILGTIGFRERYVDLLAAGALKLRWRRPAVLISDATWDVGSAALSGGGAWRERVVRGVARLAVRMIDGPHVTYAVLSVEELHAFPGRWGVPADRVVFTPFCWTLREYEDAEVGRQPYIFAGGDSYRDYELLAAAVAGLDCTVRVATRWHAPDLPANMEVGWLSQDNYMQALLDCAASVVPLRVASRSAGQQTYLNAMAAGKPVVVTDAPGVRDYVENRVTGIVVAPEAEPLRAALRWVMDPDSAEAVGTMAARGRQVARDQFSEVRYFARLRDEAEAVAARWAASSDTGVRR